MYKQSPIKNQRSKGIKIKNVLQIFLLLAVCFWLIYQVKRSYDKKKEFDENDANISLNTERNDEVIKLGRKDLHPQVEVLAIENEKDDEVVEEESTGEEEENKNEEGEQEDNKTEEKDDEESDREEKSDAEIDRVESFVDDEKERENSDETESEDVHGKIENDSSLPNQDHEGGGGNTREAREENYKADDASSAVAHDTQTTPSVNEMVNLEKSKNTSNEAVEINANHNTLVKVEDGENANNGSKSAELTHKVNETSPSNSTVTEGSNVQLEVSNNSTEVSRTTRDLNGTMIELTRVDSVIEGNETIVRENSTLQNIAPEVGNNSSLAITNNQYASNLTISTKSKGIVSIPDTESSIPEIKSIEDKFASLMTENNGASEDVTDDQTGGMKEDLDEGNSEISNELQHDSIDSSTSTISLEEKDVRNDLETLPEIQTEGSNNEDVAAE